MSPPGGGGALPPGDVAARRIAELEAIVAAQRAEIGDLRLQVDVLGTLDPVSGLPNLTGVIDLVDAAARRLDRDGEPFGVMALELAGPATSDLRHSAAVLAAALRRVDRPGWAGGGVFVVVLPGLNEAGATIVITRVLDVLRLVLGTTVEDTRIGLVLCGARPAPEAFLVVDRARRMAAQAVPGTPTVVTEPASGAG